MEWLYKPSITCGVDSGSKVIGFAAIGNGKILYASEVRTRTDISKKWKSTYCGARDVRREIDPILPKSLGGTDRVNNLVICCQSCHQKKGKLTPSLFKRSWKSRSNSLLKQKDIERGRSGERIEESHWRSSCLPGKKEDFWSGAQTKCHRMKPCLPKEHGRDAACVGHLERRRIIPKETSIRGQRQAEDGVSSA